MIFGDAVKPAETTAATEWIDGSCRGEWWTVGGLVPNDCESFVRIDAPPSHVDDWWSAYRELFAVVAEVGARHTTTPGRAWLAIWDGHGFDSAVVRPYWDEPPADEAERQEREELADHLRENSRHRNAALGDALRTVPTFHRPHRTFYLVEGPVSAVTELRQPGDEAWRNPDLVWPDDRAWFVATDVDFWSLYVGGARDLVADLADAVPTGVEPVDLDHPLDAEE